MHVVERKSERVLKNDDCPTEFGSLLSPLNAAAFTVKVDPPTCLTSLLFCTSSSCIVHFGSPHPFFQMGPAVLALFLCPHAASTKHTLKMHVINEPAVVTLTFQLVIKHGWAKAGESQLKNGTLCAANEQEFVLCSLCQCQTILKSLGTGKKRRWDVSELARTLKHFARFPPVFDNEKCCSSSQCVN